MEILEHEQHRLGRRGALEPVQDQRVVSCDRSAGQLRARRSGGRGRQDALQILAVVEAAQRIGHRQERYRRPGEVRALAAQDARATVRRAGGEFGEQPALADPGLAADERDDRNPCRSLLHGGEELGELIRTPGKDPAPQALRHGREYLRLGTSRGRNTSRGG